MTAEEIKETVTMREILSRYGISVNRSGMCSCPFHGRDKHPSMKVFKDGYKCFTCNAGGDVFTFVQNIENCSFKDAFILLGGSYQHSQDKALNQLKRAKFELYKKQKESEKDAEKELRRILDRSIEYCYFLINYSLIFSEPWCFANNILPWLLHTWNTKYIDEEEINRADVFRNYKRLESYRYS